MPDPIRDLKAAVDCLAGQDRFLLADPQLLCSVEELLGIRDRIDGLLASRLQVIDTRSATDAEYGRKTRSWLIEDRLLARKQAAKLMTVAKALPARPASEAALLAGDINLDHARNIAVSTRKVPAELQEVFETELVKAAEYVDPTALGVAARELRSRLGADESAEAAVSSGQLPETSGEKPHLICTMNYSQLLDDLNVAANAGRITLNGLEISPATARMLACDAGIVPAVLGSASEVLDLGRKTPTWSVAQRRTLNLEQPGCGWAGCQNPHGHAHHIDWWPHGGNTNVKDGVNLCLYHHYLVHHTNWQICKEHRGKIRVWRT